MSASAELHAQEQNGTVDEEKILTQSPTDVDDSLGDSASESEEEIDDTASEEERERPTVTKGVLSHIIHDHSDDNPEHEEESDEEDEEEDDEDEDEDEEPALKYERFGGSIHDLLQRDSASALAISNKLMVRVSIHLLTTRTNCY
jgi:vacuolar protein sorting-associated protein 41